MIGPLFFARPGARFDGFRTSENSKQQFVGGRGLNRF
jgi:hypothetical protein